MADKSPHWPRWIFASMAKHFKTALPTNLLFVEGEDQKTQGLADYFEFRMNGPNIRTLSGYFKFEVIVNVLVVHKKDGKSLYSIHTNVGLASAAFLAAIPIYRLGPDTSGVDDATLWACMLLTKREGKEVDISHIGQINPDLPEMQAMVQGYYQMVVEN